MEPGIALFTFNAPEDRLNGGDLRIWTLLGEGQATVVCLDKKKLNQNGMNLQDKLPWQRIHQLDLHTPIPVISRWSFSVESWLNSSSDFIEELRGSINNFVRVNPGLVWIAFPIMEGLLLTHLFRSCCPAVDITDSYSLYFYRRTRNLPKKHFLKKINALYQSWRWLQLERKVKNNASALFVAGEEDKAYLTKKAGDKVFCYGTGTLLIKKPIPSKNFNLEKKRICFFGGMSWEPNRASARYLTNELLPILLKRNRDIELHIAGSAIEQYLPDLRSVAGLYLHGFVPDLCAWLAKCQIFIMPMFQGSGVKTKLLEAMASGMAVVTNSLGAESLPDEAKSAVMVADGTNALADAVLELFDNPMKRETLERLAREMAEKYFDPVVIATDYRRAVLSTTSPWTIAL